MSGLTADDVRAIRHADTLSFIVDERDSSRAVVTAYRKVVTDGFEHELRRTIPAVGSIHSYGRDGGWRKPYITKDAKLLGSHYLDSYADHMLTIRNLVRVGDELTVEFIGDNNCEAIEEVGHHTDEMWLTIRRKGEKWARLLLMRQTGPNNTARRVHVAY